MAPSVINCIFSSQYLKMREEINVIIPNDVDIAEARVLYLLHGMTGDCHDWISNSNIVKLAEEHKIAVVLPSARNSFYTDMAYGEQYYSYIAKELPQYVQRLFGLSNKRELNMIAGLSMGGYGAFKIAFNNPDKFYAAGSFSGVMDIVSLPQMLTGNPEEDEANIRLFTGIFGKELETKGTEHDLFHLVSIDNKVNGYAISDMSLYQYCGTEDFLYHFNTAFKKLAQSKKLTLEYQEDDGSHDWARWAEQIQAFLKFFK